MANFHIVLFEPEIPPNTGNIIRLAANTNCQLHLIEPLGFDISTKSLRRAGLDYHEFIEIRTYCNYSEFMKKNQPEKIYACTTKASVKHSNARFQTGEYLLFGPETRGLPAEILATIKNKIRIPMQRDSRSLNLSNSVAVILYEALRQVDYPEMI